MECFPFFELFKGSTIRSPTRSPQRSPPREPESPSKRKLNSKNEHIKEVSLKPSGPIVKDYILCQTLGRGNYHYILYKNIFNESFINEFNRIIW